MKENTVLLEFLIYSFEKGNKDCYLQETNNLAERHDMVELLSSDLLLVKLLSAQSGLTQNPFEEPVKWINVTKWGRKKSGALSKNKTRKKTILFRDR